MIKYASIAGAIIKNRILRRNAPIFVTLCVTARCNLRCAYCYATHCTDTSMEFTTCQLLDLVDELASMGTGYISLNGGEPLLRKDLGAIVERIRRHRMFCHLSTNGLLIEDNMPVIRNIDSVAISLDGIGLNNDVNRGPGVYEKVIRAIQSLAREHRNFHTHTVLTRNNKNAVQEILSLAATYGFMAQFSPLRAEDSPDKEISLSDTELREVIADIIARKKGRNRVFFSRPAYEHMLNWPFPYSKQVSLEKPALGRRFTPCYLRRFWCHVEPDGMVYPCIVLVNKFRALNLLEVGFKKAWENLASNACQACYNICCNDINRILALHPAALWNALRIAVQRTLQGAA